MLLLPTPTKQLQQSTAHATFARYIHPLHSTSNCYLVQATVAHYEPMLRSTSICCTVQAALAQYKQLCTVYAVTTPNQTHLFAIGIPHPLL